MGIACSLGWLLHLLMLLSLSLLLRTSLASPAEAEGKEEAVQTSVETRSGPYDLSSLPVEAGELSVSGPFGRLDGHNGGGSLIEVMHTVRMERTRMMRPTNKRMDGLLGRIDTNILLAVVVTAFVLLYAYKVVVRRYSADDLTLKMSRQARWFSPQRAAYSATDGHVYVVSLDFRSLERVALPKRYTQQEKENLISLFERALQYFKNVPPEETSGYLIEKWSPGENIPPIDIRVVRLPYGQLPNKPLQ